METLLRQLGATTSADSTVLMLWHKPADTQLILDALAKSSYVQPNHFYWHKQLHTSPTQVSSYTSSCEMGTMAYTPDRTKVNWNMGTDPRKRHNFIETPAVTTYLKDSQGAVVNPCQKPPQLAEWMVSNHIKPQSNVLVIGAGAGGDVIGAVEAGANVVAIEKDHKQFLALGAELVRLAKEDNEQEDDDDEKGDEEESNEASETTSSKGGASGRSGKKKTGKGKPNQSAQGKATVPDCLICGDPMTSEEYAKQFKCYGCTPSNPVHEDCLHDIGEGRYSCEAHLDTTVSAGAKDSQAY